MRVSLGGDAQAQDEVFGQIFAALGIAVLLMYLILVRAVRLVPRSARDPDVAAAVAHRRDARARGHGQHDQHHELIGVILLMGIVAKNAILLIDFAKWAREKEGMPLREALIEAGAIRLRPILMTTFALIAGMIPVALGSGEGAQFRAPLGVAVIGGVITSTLLTLLVIPTFYEIIDEWRAQARAPVRLHPADDGGAPHPTRLAWPRRAGDGRRLSGGCPFHPSIHGRRSAMRCGVPCSDSSCPSWCSTRWRWRSTTAPDSPTAQPARATSISSLVGGDRDPRGGDAEEGEEGAVGGEAVRWVSWMWLDRELMETASGRRSSPRPFDSRSQFNQPTHAFPTLTLQLTNSPLLAPQGASSGYGFTGAPFHQTFTSFDRARAK